MRHTLDPLIQIYHDLNPPDGRDFWTSPQEDGGAPIFTLREVASVFFARSRVWLHLRLADQRGYLDGDPIEIPRSENGYRRFQLHHVELIAHAFLSHGVINLRTFSNCIVIIRAIASNYRLI